MILEITLQVKLEHFLLPFILEILCTTKFLKYNGSNCPKIED